jgi:integrase
MKKYKFSVTFRLQIVRANPKDKQSEQITMNVPILADITFNRKRTYYYTGCRIDANKWIDKTIDGVRVQQVKRNNFNAKGESSTEINTRLERIKTAIGDVFNRLEVNGVSYQTLTPKTVIAELKKELDEETVIHKTLVDFYKQFIDEEKAHWAKEKTPTRTGRNACGTETKHRTMIRHLSDYRKGLFLEDITDDFLKKFVEYLTSDKFVECQRKHREAEFKEECEKSPKTAQQIAKFHSELDSIKPLSNTYVAKSIKDIMWFMNWAVKHEYTKNVSYRNFKMQYKNGTSVIDSTNMFALTINEVRQLMDMEIESDALSRVRDVFLFCCFTGLRYSDVKKMKWSDVKDGYVEVTTKKTGQNISLILSDEAESIIKKYKNRKGYVDEVLPVISNQKYNEQLKVLGKMAGFDDMHKKIIWRGNQIDDKTSPKYKQLSSHVARRTFVTLELFKGMSPEFIRAMTGHTTSKMMQNYVKANVETLKSVKSKINLFDNDNETVFTYNITDDERAALGIPTKEEYLEIASKEHDIANLHLAFLFQRRGDAVKSLEYVGKLPDTMKVEFMQRIANNNQHQ